MKRYEIINHLIQKYNYKTFLEIGSQEQISYNNIIIDEKISVDPDPKAKADYIMTSDDFFKINIKTFDIIFVDGLHHADFTYRDIINSLKILNTNGTIVVHDVMPYSYESQLIPLEKASKNNTVAWNGDVWKAWIKMRIDHKELLMYCINTDHGCGIIQKMENNQFLYDYNNGYYKYNREEILKALNLITCEEFIKL